MFVVELNNVSSMLSFRGEKKYLVVVAPPLGYQTWPGSREDRGGRSNGSIM